MSSPAAAAGPLARAPVGTVPILWNSVDLPELPEAVDPRQVLDDIARLGYTGCQLGRGFPRGAALVAELERRGLRLAEVYVALPGDEGGPRDGARDLALAGLEALGEASGDVLVIAFDGSPERDAWSGRVGERTPRLGDEGWRRLATLLHDLADEAERGGRRLAFHPHTATWIEAPDEVAQLLALTDPKRVSLCLDVGHYVVGGGDPVAALRELGPRVGHVHLKDVDANVLERLRAGLVKGFAAAVRERIFTELGNGILDLDGVLGALARLDYAGWIMIEQDSSWLRPAEAAAVGRRVYDFSLRHLAQGATGGGAPAQAP